MSYQKSRYRPKSYSYRRNSRRGNRKYNPKALIILLVVLAVTFWVGSKIVGLFSSSSVADSATATLEVSQGIAEFTLGGSEEPLWTRANSGQEFLQGDTLKTNGNGIASVDILGNIIFLRSDTEIEFTSLSQKKDGKKDIEIMLKSGEIWTKVVEDDFADNDSSFVIAAKNTKTYARGTVFDITTTDNEDTIRLSRGKVDVDILEQNGSGIKNVAVGIGQKLVASQEAFEKASNGEIVLEINDTEFIQSEWNLNNLEQFYPQEAAKIRAEIEKSAQKIESTSENENIDSEIESPIILEPEAGARIAAAEELVVITGTVPENIFQVSVNGYTLTKFQPGDRKWSYFASRKFGTMLPGENKYSIKAIRRDGKESAATDINIFYEGTASGVEEKREIRDIGVRVLEAQGFASPTILNPSRVDLSQPFQTASQVVTISGIVDPKTNRVEVNGFQLRKFQPGDTDFSYIANANYGNMKVGENIYEVTSYGPDGSKSSSSINVIYTPIEL